MISPCFRNCAQHQSLNLAAHRSAHASMDVMACHSYAPLVAAGSHRSLIELVDTKGEQVDCIRYHIGEQPLFSEMCDCANTDVHGQ